jgi:hypothetical protein
MGRIAQGPLLAVLAAALGACGGESEPTPTVVEEVEVVEEAEVAEHAPAKAAAREADTAEALAILKEMSDFLGEQQQFSFRAELGWDSVQVTGQKLEFGGTRSFTVRRPDRLRVEARDREGEKITLFFDSLRISIDLPDDDAYVSVAKPGTIDEVIDYLTDDLGAPAQLAEFVHSDLYDDVAKKFESGFWVGEATVGGVLCDHIALITDPVDVQIWVEQGDRPLPRRLVYTYKTVEGHPQFWADMDEWKPLSNIPDALFAYEPPKGAERLPLRAALEIIEEEMSP